MTREDISFQTSDGITLRGWFYTSTKSTAPLPCLILSHGFSALKEMELSTFASYFTTHLSLTCLVYDNRNFGSSDNHPSSPRQEIIPAQQCSDISDAITYAQSRDDVDENKIGIWGSSYSGGHVLWVGAVDRRVKAVLSQVPCVRGWDNFHRLTRPDFIPGLNQTFQKGELEEFSAMDEAVCWYRRRSSGKSVREGCWDDSSGWPEPVSDFGSAYTRILHLLYGLGEEMWLEERSDCKDVRYPFLVPHPVWHCPSIEEFRAYEPSAHIHHISPTPLLMTVAENDTLAPTDLALAAYGRALEPKELHILPGGHFGGYSGPNFEKNAGRQVEFLKKTLCVWYYSYVSPKNYVGRLLGTLSHSLRSLPSLLCFLLLRWVC